MIVFVHFFRHPDLDIVTNHFSRHLPESSRKFLILYSDQPAPQVIESSVVVEPSLLTREELRPIIHETVKKSVIREVTKVIIVYISRLRTLL